MKGHKQYIRSICYFPDGKRMVSGSMDHTTRRWDLETGEEIEKVRDHCKERVRAVEVSRDSRWVVTAAGMELRVCEVQTETVRTLEVQSNISCIDISGDGILLAGAENSRVKIWNLETGELVPALLECIEYVNAVRFSHDSKKLAVKSKFLEVWDVELQKRDVRMEEAVGIGSLQDAAWPLPLFWTKDKTIVTATGLGKNKTISEFDASTLETVGAVFQDFNKKGLDLGSPITSLALSLDCTLLASASNNTNTFEDNSIKLWAFVSRQLLASFNVQSVNCLILSPDLRQLVYTTQRSDKIYLCDIHSVPQARTSTPLVHFGAISFIAKKNQIISEELPVHSYISPPTVGSRPPQLRPDPPEFLPSSSHAHTVFSARNIESRDLPPKTTLQDLSNYITKDEDYPVARGGFGEIWKCTYDIDHKPIKVAVKSLQVYADDQLGPAKAKKIRRIERELSICANLEHPNILPVFGYTYGFGPFLAIVSPWAENGNLTVYLERESAALTLVRRFQLLRDIIDGLQYLHTNSVIHGDFTGPNVLIHGDGTACVADFGLSLMYSEVISPSQASWTSTLKGNVRWMAPELLMLEREDGSPTRPSEQSDIFSFGGIMLQVLTNKIPYYYLVNDAAIVLCIAKSEKPSRARYPELSESYWTFIEQCWSTDPRDRPSTGGANGTIRDEFSSLSGSS
ncbi:kinase-like protein [Suillus decipiens]|nr:kinase-like protein [Suillus decipiens]